MSHCEGCGQLTGILAYDAALQDLYARVEDGRANIPALVITDEDMWHYEADPGESERDLMMAAMERSMVERGICPSCSRPDLTNVRPDQIMSEEDFESMSDMWAIEAAERRAGC